MNNPNDKQVAGTHYKAAFQHWDLVEATGMGYFEGQVSKYVTRHKLKNGVQDVEKAVHFMEKYLSILRNGPQHRDKEQPTIETLNRYVAANSLERPEAGVVWACMAWTHVGQLEDALATLHNIRAGYVVKTPIRAGVDPAGQDSWGGMAVRTAGEWHEVRVVPVLRMGDMTPFPVLDTALRMVGTAQEEEGKRLEAFVLAELVHYCRKWGLNVPSPDYLNSDAYSPQWRVNGSTYSWRCPRTGKTLAVVDKVHHVYTFSPQGSRDTDGAEPGPGYVNQG